MLQVTHGTWMNGSFRAMCQGEISQTNRGSLRDGHVSQP